MAPRSAWSAVSLALALAAPALAQQPPPSTAGADDGPDDAATLRVEMAPSSDVEVGALVATWARRFKALPIVDPQLAGIRVRLATPVDLDLTWGTVKQVLDLYDVVITESHPAGSAWVITANHRRNLPGRSGLVAGRVVGADAVPRHDELVTAIVRVQHGAGAMIFSTLRGIMARDPNRLSNILYVQGPELIIVVDLAPRVAWCLDIVRALDVEGPRRVLLDIELRAAPADDVARSLSAILGLLAGPAAPGMGPPQPAPQVEAHADARTNRLYVAVPAQDEALVRGLVTELDARAPTAPRRLHVYRCRDASAKTLAERLRDAVGAPSAGPDGKPVAAGPGVVETRITADEENNALVIQAEPDVHQEIVALLGELDRRRRRVLLEFEVWEVSTPTDQLALGVELAALDQAHDGSTRGHALTSFGLTTPSIVSDADGVPARVGRLPALGGGLTAALTRGAFDRVPIIVSALASFEHATAITRSFAATNDNEKCEFKVADSLPYVTQTTNQGATVSGVSFVDASTTLSLKPQVNSDDNLTLEVSLVLSSFSGAGSTTLPPGTSSRTYTGKVTVQNHRYVVFGGLEQETKREVETKVPFLGDLPVLGHLFKTMNRARTSTKVYVFVRPTIFSDGDSRAEGRLADRLRERAHVLAERDAWVPPVVPDRLLAPAGWDLQDEALVLFGTGSADPFRAR